MAQAITTTIVQTGTLGTTPDSWLDNQNITTNYGTNNNFRLRRGGGGTILNYYIIQFNIQGLAAFAGQRITNAKLELYALNTLSHGAGTFEFRQILASCAEASMTWQLRSTFNAWSGAGCSAASSTQQENQAGADHYFSASDAIQDFSYTPPASDGLVTFIDNDPVFTDYINELASGLWGQGYGLLIRPSSSSTPTFLGRQQDYATASDRPKLTVTHRARTAFFVGDGLGR